MSHCGLSSEYLLWKYLTAEISVPLHPRKGIMSGYFEIKYVLGTIKTGCLLVEESYLCLNGTAAESNRFSFLLSVVMFTGSGQHEEWNGHGMGKMSPNSLRMKQTKMDTWNITVRASVCPTDAKYRARKECRSCLCSPGWRTYGERVSHECVGSFLALFSCLNFNFLSPWAQFCELKCIEQPPTGRSTSSTQLCAPSACWLCPQDYWQYLRIFFFFFFLPPQPLGQLEVTLFLF